MMIMAGVNAKKWLTMVYEIKDLFGILVTMIVKVINYVTLDNIWIMQIVDVEKC